MTQPTPKSSPDSTHPGGVPFRLSVVLAIAALVIATGLSLTAFSLHRARLRAAANAAQSFDLVTTRAAVQTRMHVLRAVPLAKTIAALMNHGLNPNDADTLARQLVLILRANPGYAWISYSDRDGSFTGVYATPDESLQVSETWVSGADGPGEILYNVKPNGSWVFQSRQKSSYDPRQRPFYQQVQQTGQLAWVGPYVFYDQGIPGVTCAVPVFESKGNLRGVVTVDFDLLSLSRFTSNIVSGAKAHVIIVTPDGTVLADPDAQIQPKPNTGATGALPKVTDVNDPLAAAMYAAIPTPDLQQATPTGQPIRAAGDASRLIPLRFNYDGRYYLAACKTFTMEGDLTWMVVAAAPISDFFAGAYHDAEYAAGVSALALVIAVFLAILLGRRVSKPIVALSSFMRRVGAGDLEATAKLGGSREFRELSINLNDMLIHLRDRLRLRHSLAVAQQVQQRLLPDKPPKCAGIDVAGFSAYCDETGGDYYDFLVLGPDRSNLFIAIGDVMGHGVAAALPMAGARAVLRNRATEGHKLGHLLGDLNRMLADDLRGTSFMTMLLASIDPSSAEVRWASAGHDPILLFDPQSNQFTELKGSDIPLGIEKDIDYDDFSHGGLLAGQILLLGTDGVWETLNPTHEFYGKPRLQEVIRAAANLTAKEISEKISKDIETFRATAPQKDDITFVVVKIVPAPHAENRNA